MATIVLGAVGSAIGGGFAGTFLGFTGAAIGGVIGSTVGTLVDSWIISSLAPGQRIEGPRMDSLRVTSASEGVVIPRVYGRMRIGGNIIWATDFREEVNTTRQGGGKGGGPSVTTTEYLYYASFAVGICEGQITGIGRIWADGEVLDTTDLTWRLYKGGEGQQPDPFIAARMGAGRTPAYRGTAYIVFEELPLASFGNRLPQLSFEVFRPLDEADTAEGLVKAVTMIPAAGEFAYGTSIVRLAAGGAANVNAAADTPDMLVSLDRLEAMVPAVESVSLVVSWFGTDLRAAHCNFMPKVEVRGKNTTPRSWSVAGLDRVTAPLISYVDGAPAFGSTPDDVSVIEAIQELKARGKRVVLYPFLMMDIPAGNALPGFPSYVVKSWAECRTVATGTPTGGNGQMKSVWIRGYQFKRAEWPSNFYGLMQTRADGTGWLNDLYMSRASSVPRDPASNATIDATQVDDLVYVEFNRAGAEGMLFEFRITRIVTRSYANFYFEADFTGREYTVAAVGADDGDGSGQPIYPWRGRLRPSNADGAVAAQITTLMGTAVPSHFPAGSGAPTYTGPSEWKYRRFILHLAALARAAGGVDAFLIGSEMVGLTTATDTAGVYPFVTALKTLAADVKTMLPGTKVSYAADWTEYHSHQSGTNLYFHLDPLWSDPNIDFIGIDNYMPLSDWRDGWDHLDALEWPSIYDRGYLQANVAGGDGYDWFYASAADRAAQIRTPITDGLGKSWVFRYKDIHGWWSNQHRNRPGGAEAATPTAWVPQSKPIWFTELGCPAIDRGTNQPNVFVDPKSSESFTPYFSRGWRDDAIQRAYLEATYLFWGKAENNPISPVYGGPMINLAGSAAWTWDARPYPFFPELSSIWSDGANWRLGHWLTGRLGAVSLAALVRDLCRRAGMATSRIDVSGLTGACDGYVISALESPRTSITMLARHFGVDAVESQGVIRFIMRGRAPVATISPDDMVASNQRDVMELTRGQETELPQALKWQIARSDADYDALTVEARRITAEASRVGSDSFAVAVPPEEADRRCRRALMEAWIGRETGSFRLPPSRLALDPGDVIRLDHDGRLAEMRILSIADAEARAIDAIRQDRDSYDLPPGSARPASLSRPAVFGSPQIAFLDVPQLREGVPPHQPLIAGNAQPWPGRLAVCRSADTSGFERLSTFTRRAQMGVLDAPLFSGPVSRFDRGNSVFVTLQSGTLASVTDLRLFGGENTFAIEQPTGQWEILQAANAELLEPGRYRLSRLLRGQRGTESRMAAMVPAGARVVVLDAQVAVLPVDEADIGLPWNWRIGPASRPVSDDSYLATTFTPRAIGLRPFSPVHVQQPYLRGRVPGDLTIRWTRRDRSLTADNWNAAEVPMSEASEQWQVQILDGAAVKRTLSSNGPSVVYSAAQQITDRGALLAPGDSLQVRIAQVGQVFGPGTAAATTLFF